MTYPLAVQLYTLRYLSDDLGELLKTVAEAGYAGVEGGYGPETDAAAYKRLLDEHGLRLVSSHALVEVLESGLPGIIAQQRTLDNDVLIIPWIGPEHYRDDAESWQALGRRFNRVAEQVRAEGLTLLYHNHSFEFGQYGGKLGLEHLLDSAPTLGLELDIGWCAEGGVDPMPLIDKYAGRIRRVHVKDRAPEGENIDQDGWADVGHGIIEWPPLLQAVKAAGAEWFIVEHDKPKDPVETVRRSYEYLKAL